MSTPESMTPEAQRLKDALVDVAMELRKRMPDDLVTNAFIAAAVENALHTALPPGELSSWLRKIATTIDEEMAAQAGRLN